MKTVGDAFNDAKERSTKVSDLVRQLAFAGIAVVWIFKKDNKGQPLINETLALAAFVFVLGLGLDVFQYLWLTLAPWVRAKNKERELGNKNIPFAKWKETPIGNPSWVSTLGWMIWVLKVASIVTGWAVLIRYLAHAIGHT